MNINKNLKIYIKFFISIFVSGAILFKLFEQIEYDQLIESYNNIDVKYIIILILLSVFVSFLTALRFSTALKIINFKISILESWSYVLAVAPINLFVPSKGGEFGKAYFLKNKIKYSKTFKIVIIEKFLDVIALLIIGLVGSVFLKLNNIVLIFLVFLSILIFIPFILIKFELNTKFYILNKIIKTVYSFKLVIKNPKIILFLFLNSLSIWLLFSLVILLVFASIGSSPSFLIIMVVYPLSIIVGLLPVTISGLGTRDAAFVYLFGYFSIIEEHAIIVSLSYFLLSYLLPAALGTPFSFYFFNKKEN